MNLFPISKLLDGKVEKKLDRELESKLECDDYIIQSDEILKVRN